MKLAVLLAIPAIASALTLPTCSGSPINTQDVVTIAEALCSFEPTAATIAALLGAKGATFDTATSVAKSICSAVPAPASGTTSFAAPGADNQVGVVTVGQAQIPVVGHYHKLGAK